MSQPSVDDDNGHKALCPLSVKNDDNFKCNFKGGYVEAVGTHIYLMAPAEDVAWLRTISHSGTGGSVHSMTTTFVCLLASVPHSGSFAIFDNRH